MTKDNLRRLAGKIEDELRVAGDEERAVQEKRYLKSELTHFGTRLPVIRKVAKRGAKELDLDEAVELVRVLWSKRAHELRAAAVEVLVAKAGELRSSDLGYVEELIRESKTWAFVDNLAVKITGSLVERFPRLHRTLDRWSRDEDFWVRRSALLAHLKPLGRGEGDFERFARYADAMLEEKEFFIRKAIGWVLREAGKKRPELVSEWLLPRASRASGVTMREAVRYLPKRQAEALMAAYAKPSISV